MTCPLCKQHYPMIDGFHYDDGGFLECEDLAMTFNREEAARQNEELARDALKSLIRDALKDGPGFAKDIGQRVGEQPNVIVRVLHEMQDDMEVDFVWTRGYKLSAR